MSHTDSIEGAGGSPTGGPRPTRRGARAGRRRGVVAVALLVLPLLTIWAPAPASAERDALVWGAYTRPSSGQSERAAVEELEARAGRQLGVVRVFDLWDSPFPSSYDRWLRDTGRVPIYSIKPARGDGSVIPWKAVASAQPGQPVHDDIVRWADRIKAYGGFMYLTFNHEPEASASAGLGTDEDFVAAWRRFVDVFRARGVTNVEFMWIMTEHSFYQVPSTDRRYAPKWFPGAAWVDHIGADSYNDYTCRTESDSPWKSLATDIEGLRRFGLLYPDKGLWLAEWASAVDPADAGRRPSWVDEAALLFEQPGYEQFRGVSYFDSYRPGTPCSWYLEQDAAVGRWADMGSQPLFSGVAAPTTPPPPPPPPPEGPSVLLVAATPLNASDAAVRSRLAAHGYAVEVVDDDAFATASEAGRDAVLISATASQSATWRRARTLAVPVLTWKPYLYDDLGLTVTDPAGYGVVSGTTVVVDDSAAPFDTGLSGSVQILGTTGSISNGVPAGGFTAATVGGRGALFGVGEGEPLADGSPSPSCRVALPLHARTAEHLTAAGWQLLDRAVAWASSC